MKSARVDFKGKYATIEFDESVTSAQEVARAMATTPHMMGRDMQYGGVLLLSVPGLKDEATGAKATAALSKVEGVAKVTPYPAEHAVGIEFADKGKVTTTQLIQALEAAGLKGNQYGMASDPGGRDTNGLAGAMPDHAGMAMGNGGMPGPGAMGPGMPCGCVPGVVQPYYVYPTPRVYYGPGVPFRGGCGCCR